MKIIELTESVTPDQERLLAITRFLIGRSEDTDANKKISVRAFIELARDFGMSVSKQQLIDISNKPPLSNLIQNIKDNEIYFRGAKEADDTMPVDKARETVKKMAKRAAKN